VLEVW